MTEQTAPSPQILQQSEIPTQASTMQQPSSPPPPPAVPKKKSVLPLILAVIVILVLLSVVSQSVKPTDTTTVTVKTTGTPTSTPGTVSTRVVNYFATESAFVTFETTVDRFPKLIQGAVLQDQTVLPPVLDLPLGF